MPEKPSKQTIGSIIREMVDSGESFESIKKTLLGLDVPAQEAEVLVNLYRLRVSPAIAKRIELHLHKKLSAAKKAENREPERREASILRRRNSCLESILNRVSKISFSSASRNLHIRKTVSEYREIIELETEIKKELERLLNEALEENLSRRDVAKVHNALSDLMEL